MAGMRSWIRIFLRAGVIVAVLSIIFVAIFDTARDALPKIDMAVQGSQRELAQVGLDQYLVVAVADGDTITVSRDGSEYKVRLIGVDTPESVDPRKPVQCFAQQSSDYTKQLLLDTVVTLVPDESQSNTDKYDRLLRYVLLPNGELANQQIIRDGYGYEYTYRTAYQYQRAFKEAQAEARAEKRGLWSDNTCNGSR